MARGTMFIPGVPRLPPGASCQRCVRPGGPGKYQRAEARQEKIARCDVFREATSPGFRRGLLVKDASGPEGRVSTSGRRPAKKKSHDAMFFVKQRPPASAGGFLSTPQPPIKAPGGSPGTPCACRHPANHAAGCVTIKQRSWPRNPGGSPGTPCACRHPANHAAGCVTIKQRSWPRNPGGSPGTPCACRHPANHAAGCVTIKQRSWPRNPGGSPGTPCACRHPANHAPRPDTPINDSIAVE